MKKWLWILLIFPFVANAAYDRNTARPVNDVIFGSVESVRYITQQEIVKSQAHGWETLLGAVIGGVVGHQFGGGKGKQVATAVGAAAGAGIVQYQTQKKRPVQYQLVELLIRTQEGKLIDVIQDPDQNMIFNRDDEVRILYFNDGVRVDKTY